MPPPLLADPTRFDPRRLIFDREQIQQVNPHRHEWSLLDGILHFDDADRLMVAVKHIEGDDWWVRGHIPDRPLLPGVLMIEAAAQLASFGHARLTNRTGFLGFAGVDHVKFRTPVTPPADLIIIGKGTVVRPRRAVFITQGFVDSDMAFEAKITGMVV